MDFVKRFTLKEGFPDDLIKFEFSIYMGGSSEGLKFCYRSRFAKYIIAHRYVFSPFDKIAEKKKFVCISLKLQ